MKNIISLTTIPSRLKDEGENGIKKCIASLVSQKFDEPYEIHFNIPKKNRKTGEDYVVPKWLEDLSSADSRFKIFKVTEDVGPITKILYTLRRESDPESIIVVCDDDLIYHPKMLEEQVKNQRKYENTAVGYDGCRAERDNGEELFHDIRDHFVVSIYRNVYVNYLQHYKTISYKRKYFGDDFEEFIQLGSWNDDITIGAYLTKKNIKKMVTFYEFDEKLITIEQWNKKGGVSTFPVIAHTHHEGMEGCSLFRAEKANDNFMAFLKLGYLK